MAEFDIHIGQESDIPAIVHFQTEMARESEGTFLDPERVTRGVTAAINDQSKGIYLIASYKGTPAGSLMLTKEWSDWNDRWYWWIQSVYIRPEYRRKGLYREMYEKVKQMAKEQDITQIRLYVDKTNFPAQAVYARVGMSECHYLMYEEVLSDKQD